MRHEVKIRDGTNALPIAQRRLNTDDDTRTTSTEGNGTFDDVVTVEDADTTIG